MAQDGTDILAILFCEGREKMKFTIERNWIEVIGVIWLPPITCAKRIDLSPYDMENIGEPTRENVEQWLCTHAGDFQSITDFHAIVGETDIPWATEENEFTYFDCMWFWSNKTMEK